MNTARLLCIAVVCVIAGTAALARDLKTVNGEVFKNITITKQDPTGLLISHDEGVIFIDFRSLAAAEQKEFGYDPAAYTAAWKQKIDAEKARREQVFAAQQAAAARARAQGAAPQNTQVPQPLTPQTATGLQFTLDSPGFRYGPYDYTGRGFSNVVPPVQGGPVPS